MKTIEVTTKVTQTLTRTYQIEVPIDKTKNDISDMVESSQLPPSSAIGESESQDVNIEVLTITDKTAEQLKIKREQGKAPFKK